MWASIAEILCKHHVNTLSNLVTLICRLTDIQAHKEAYDWNVAVINIFKTFQSSYSWTWYLKQTYILMFAEKNVFEVTMGFTQVSTMTNDHNGKLAVVFLKKETTEKKAEWVILTHDLIKTVNSSSSACATYLVQFCMHSEDRIIL